MSTKSVGDLLFTISTSSLPWKPYHRRLPSSSPSPFSLPLFSPSPSLPSSPLHLPLPRMLLPMHKSLISLRSLRKHIPQTAPISRNIPHEVQFQKLINKTSASTESSMDTTPKSTDDSKSFDDGSSRQDGGGALNPSAAGREGELRGKRRGQGGERRGVKEEKRNKPINSCHMELTRFLLGPLVQAPFSLKSITS